MQQCFTKHMQLRTVVANYFHRCLRRYSLKTHNNKPNQQLQLFFPAILQLALLQPSLLTLRFHILFSSITFFLHGIHLQFALNQSHMLNQEKAMPNFLKFLSTFLLGLYQLLQVNYAITRTFSLKKDQYSQVIPINKNVPPPLLPPIFPW